MRGVPPSRVWVTADTHFGHNNIRLPAYCDRPFASIEEHDAQLIANWNRCVQDGDVVFHLGDFAFKNQQRSVDIYNQLHGVVYWLRGNHDQGHPFPHNLHDVLDVRIGGGHTFFIFLSHYAHRVWNKSHHGSIHLYGHSHNSLPELMDSMSMDVGVDSRARHPAWVAEPTKPKAEDYRPFNLLEVITYLQTTHTFKPVDHHQGNVR